MTTLLAILMTPSLALANLPPITQDWKQVHQDELVTVYRKEMSNSPVLALRGRAKLDASIGKILSAVLDIEHRKEWMQHVERVEVIKTISPTERIEYAQLSPPWPIKDRDLLFNEKIEIDRAARKVTVRLKSVDLPERPERSDRVRAKIYEATFTLVASKDGKSTEIDAESHADPRGSIPKWVVNLYQRKLPHKTLTRLLARVKKPGIQEHPLTVGLFDQRR